MKKLNYILLLSILLSAFFAVACDDNKPSDKENPQIFDIRFNMNDTIYFSNPTEEDPLVGETYFVVLNDSLQDPSIPDVIVIDHPLKFKGRFADNEGLSSVFIHLWGDTADISEKYSWYRLKKVPNSNMFGKTEYVMRNILLETKIPTVMDVKIEKDGNEIIRSLPVREDDEKYYFNIRCVDAVGNIDSTTYEKLNIRLLSMESVIKEFPHQKKKKK